MRKNRGLALLLVLVMLVGLLPTGVWAARVSDEPVELSAPAADGPAELPAQPEDIPEAAQLLNDTAAGSVTGTAYSGDSNAYEIYPVPHSVSYGSGGSFTMTTDVNVVADEGVDSETIAFLREILTRFSRTMTTSAAAAADKTNIVLAIDSAMVENAGTNGEGHYDPYTLTASNASNANGVITITGKDTDCVYYGLATLQMMFTSFNGAKFLNVEISDYSNTIFRGFIEGFYGGFDYAQRESQIRSIRDVKGNTYVFASKTDSYHGGSNWDKAYPTDEANQIKSLIAVCDAMKVNYVWSLHIGKADVLNGIDPNENDDADKQPIDETLYNQQLQKVLNKFESLYQLGVRGFNILNDDTNTGTYRVQVKLLNDVNAWLKTKGDCMPLIYCCMGYNTSWAKGGYGGNGTELPALRGLDDDIYLYWTGADVNSPITQDSVNYPNTQSGQSVITWLNYPCSEHAKSGLFLGDISTYVQNANGLTGQYGLLSNGIASPEANKVAYFQLLSWAWNRDNYTSYMTRLWENCFKYLQPEVAGAYRTIARNVSNRPNSSRVTSFPESEYLKDRLAAIQTAIQAGSALPAADVTALQTEFANILAAITAFRAGCDNATLKAEMEPWLRSLTDVVTAAQKGFAALEALADDDTAAAQTAYAQGMAALDTWGSYDSSNPYANNDGVRAKVQSGSLRLQPFAAALLSYASRSLDFEGNLALNAAAYASGQEAAGNGPGKAVDGISDANSRWVGNYMKNHATNPSWIVVDLGANVTSISRIDMDYHKLVWPVSYKIQVAGADFTPTDYSAANGAGGGPMNANTFAGNNAENAACWTTIKTVTGASYSSDCTVTIDSFDAPLPAGARYLRIYYTAMNPAAGGHAIRLKELTVTGVRSAAGAPIEGAQNLALNRPVTASSVANGKGPELAVDGVTRETEQWNSEDMKTSSTTESGTQTPQWLQVDLGATGSRIDRIKLWYNMKVWPMVYEIQTTDTPNDAASWQTVVRVERSPNDGGVKNGTGQNIADETGSDDPNNALNAANTDTITATSSPALRMTTLKRYVRLYVVKVNTAAPGNNVTLREIEIFGVNDNIHPPVDVAALLATATTGTVTATGSAVTLPAAPTGGTLAVAGSTLENVVANDGSIGGKNIGARQVQLLIRAWDNAAPDNYQQKNLTVTVPDHKSAYPSAWFPAVTNANPKPEVIPAIQEWYGYNGSFTLTDTSRIVINDAGGKGIRKAAENMKADLAEITGLDLPIVVASSGRANDIYIESLTADTYDLGQEGYLMRVSDQGVQIYAPTYTGCLFGTITVEQILWQAADHLSVPKGIMRDYPAYAVRGVKLDVARTPYRYQQLQDYAKIMLWYKMSEYDLHVNDNDNANIASGSATMETHSGFHRLESTTFPSLAKSSGTKHAGIPAALVNADYYNNDPDYQGNPTYTKAQWRALAQLTQNYGMYLLTELDLPAHSLVYNKYAQSNPDHISWLSGGTMPASSFTTNAGYLELLDLTGTNKDRALRLASELWDEYTGGNEPTIYGNIVHIGADEYWVHTEPVNNAFARFTDTMRQIIQDNLGEETKVRMWGASAGSGSFQTATTVLGKTHAELAEDYQLDVWHPNYENPAQRAKEGYGIVNCRDAFLYGNPGRSNRDVPNAEYLFNSWDPTMFGGSTNPLPGEPNLLGAKAVIWGDQSQEGMTELDIHQRVLRAIAVISEKTWGGTTHSEGEFSDYELRFNRLAEGPGTQIAMDVDSDSSLVLAYDFDRRSVANTGEIIYDLSGNGYNGVFEGEPSFDDQGTVSLDKDTFLRTPIKTLPYPYTVSVTVTADSNSAQNAALFSGYDGRIQLKGSNGKLCANVNYFTRDFNYTVPTDGTEVTLTLVGTQQATRLYVDGQLVTFLSQKQDQDGVAPGSVSTLYSSVPLPLEKIGEGFQGTLSHLRVYNKALSAAEVAVLAGGTDDGLVNVAQNAVAGGSSSQGANDNAVQRVCYASKAVDGEEEELWSYWRADSSGDTLTVDLGKSHPISRIDLQWRDNAPGSTLQTSLDGKTWAAFTQNTVTDARFIKLTAGGAGNLAELLAYEAVDKTALVNKLTEAERLLDPDSGFGTTVEGTIAYAPVALARAVKENPLATNEEVAKAVQDLQKALDRPIITPSDNDTLSALTLSQGTLRPAFSPTTLYYRASVPNNVTQVTVTPTLTHQDASVRMFCNGRHNTQNPNVATLKEGVNDIQLWVSAPDGASQQTYVITLTRAAAETPVVPPSGPSGGGGGITAPAETTTETRDDGSKVTTVTKSDGSKVETVERVDGSKTEAVTAKDGAVTITATDANGEELAKVELPAAIPAPETKFEDLDTVPWAEEAINNAAGLELVKGIGGNKYDPITPMTRGALATVLHRLSQGKTDYDVTFKDVAQGKYYTEGVAWAAKVNVVKGITEDVFAPDQIITREQLAVMLARYAKLIGLDTRSSGKTLDQFADGGKTGVWAAGSVAWCVEQGILKGKGGETLDPTANVSRAEVAVMLDRFLALVK